MSHVETIPSLYKSHFNTETLVCAISVQHYLHMLHIRGASKRNQNYISFDINKLGQSRRYESSLIDMDN